MKAFLITGVMGLVIIGGMAFIPNGIETINKTIEVEKQVEIDALQKRIDEAVLAQTASTTEKAQKAYDDVLEKETKRIEDEVKADYIAEIEATITDSSY